MRYILNSNLVYHFFFVSSYLKFRHFYKIGCKNCKNVEFNDYLFKSLTLNVILQDCANEYGFYTFYMLPIIFLLNLLPFYVILAFLVHFWKIPAELKFKYSCNKSHEFFLNITWRFLSLSELTQSYLIWS